MNGLILNGGGSKGAYQAGWLVALSEILETENVPFNAISGISVGSINASILAMEHESLRKAALKLKNYWLNMRYNNVYDLGKYGILSSWTNLFGNSNPSAALFDNSPLRNFLEHKLDFNKINRPANRAVNPVYLNVHSYSYSTAKNVVFTNWINKLKYTRPGNLTLNHIMSSCALPYIFPSQEINGELFGDGGLKLQYPSNLLIKQGCRKILGISLDHESSASNKISDHLFNSVFPDAINDDFNRIKKLNATIKRFDFFSDSPRKIDALLVRPSVEDYQLKENLLSSLPKSLRMAAKWLNISEDANSTILNYIVFDREYAEYLIDKGYKDCINASNEIINFFDD